MSGKRRGKALYEGLNIPYSPELGRLIGPWPAKAAQQIHYYSVGAKDGWVALSVADLADDLKCGRGTSGRALKTLAERGLSDVLEGDDRTGRNRYRLRYDALQELLPRVSLSDDARANAERLASQEVSQDGTADDAHPSQNGTPEPSQDGTPNPDQERDAGASNGASAETPDLDLEEEEEEETPSPPPVHRDVGGGGDQDQVRQEAEGNGSDSWAVPAKYGSLCFDCGYRIEPPELQRPYTGNQGRKSEYVHDVCPRPSYDDDGPVPTGRCTQCDKDWGDCSCFGAMAR